MALILTSLNACSQNEELTVYNKSVDVHLEGWTPTDTLFYDIVVTDPATIKDPIVINQSYRLGISIRHAANYPLTNVPFRLLLQQTDTTGGYIHPIRNILRQNLAPIVRDTTGSPLGDTWGSLIASQTVPDGISIRFDSAGTYRFLLIPEIGGLKSLPGVASIGIQLKK